MILWAASRLFGQVAIHGQSRLSPVQVPRLLLTC